MRYCFRRIINFRFSLSNTQFAFSKIPDILIIMITMFGSESAKYCNSMRTALLFAVMWIPLVLLWLVLGAKLSLLIWFVIIGIVINAISYWFADKLVISVIKAREVTEEEEPVLYGIVREISARLEKPMPKIYVAPYASPNSFATGRSERYACLCCTRGLLNILNERELRSVVSHELMHVYNHDIFTAALASLMAAAVSYFGYWLMYFGEKYFQKYKNNDIKSKSKLQNLLKICVFSVVTFIGKGLSFVFGPIGALFVKLALSSDREFSADKYASNVTKDPAALASALNKISYGAQLHKMELIAGVRIVSALMIVDPYEKHSTLFSRLFSIHPPVDDRIEKLMHIANEVRVRAKVNIIIPNKKSVVTVSGA